MIPIETVAGLEVAKLQGENHGGYILILHGFAADLYDLIPLSGLYRKSPRPTWLFPNGPLEIPIGPDWIGRAWFPLDIERIQLAIKNQNFDDIPEAFPNDIENARQQIEFLLDELEIPRHKLIIGGFSQGAVLATEIALHSPMRFAGLLIFSGTLVQKEEWQKLAVLQKPLPFFQCHGKQDPLLPFSKAKELEFLLKDAGLQGKLHAFEGGHEVPSQLFSTIRNFLENILDK